MTLPSPRPFQVNPCIKSSLYRKQYSCFLSRCNDISPSVPVRTYTRPFPSSVRTDQYGNRNTAWNEGVWLAKNCSRDPSVSSHLSISLSLSLSPSISLYFFLFLSGHITLSLLLSSLSFHIQSLSLHLGCRSLSIIFSFSHFMFALCS